MQTVDDGSGVIDCSLPYNPKVGQTKPRTPAAQHTGLPKPKAYGPRGDATKMSDYYPKESIPPPRQPITPTEPPEWEPAFPIPDIGDTIRVEGKLKSKFGQRIILLHKLGMSFSNITLCCCSHPSHRAVFHQG